MKIAIATVEKDLSKNINQTFGRAPYFAIYNSEDNSVEFLDNEAINAPGGAGIKASQFLVDKGIDAIIGFRLGENALKVLRGADVELFAANSDKSIKENIDLLLENQLESLVDIHSGYHHS
ncbi:MAG: NifB/NifX family molybdenum-iron cluster-binding protein [Pleomorphochaeta sp.]